MPWLAVDLALVLGSLLVLGVIAVRLYRQAARVGRDAVALSARLGAAAQSVQESLPQLPAKPGATSYDRGSGPTRRGGR